MAAPAATSVFDRYQDQQAALVGSSAWVYVYDAGSDTAYLDAVSKAFEVSADCTLALKLVSGQTLTRAFKAGTIYPLRVMQLLSTGTVLGGATVLFYC